MVIQRWTIQRVFSGLEWRWTYTLRDQPQNVGSYPTAHEAAKAADREWRKRR